LAGSSDPRARRAGPHGRRRAGLVAGIVAAIVGAGPLGAKVFLTQEEALRLAFPGASVERKTAFLTDAEKEEVARRAGGAPPAALQPYYVATRNGAVVGTAYFDVHVVRTENEVLFVVVTPAGTVGRVEVLSFSEPEEYLPKTHWYAQFPGRALDEELSVKRAIRPVTGATLTVRATTGAVRRVLALHEVLERRGPPAPGRGR